MWCFDILYAVIVTGIKLYIREQLLIFLVSVAQQPNSCPGHCTGEASRSYTDTHTM